jgi:hypothetical protein
MMLQDHSRESRKQRLGLWQSTAVGGQSTNGQIARHVDQQWWRSHTGAGSRGVM